MQSSRTDSDKGVSTVGLKSIDLQTLRHDIRSIRSNQNRLSPSSKKSSHPQDIFRRFVLRSTTPESFTTPGDAPSKPLSRQHGSPKKREVVQQQRSPDGVLANEDVQNTTPVYHTAKEEDPWSKSLVLSLDGEGDRGLQILVVLDRLMEDVHRIEGGERKPKPCLYFDYIVGTSTGGLFAIMLGRLRMTIDECVEAYQRFPDSVFVQSWRPSLLQSRNKVNSHTLENSISQLVREHAPAALQRGQEDIFASDPEQCKTAVVSFSAKSGKPFMFRTYDFSDRSLLRIADAARATYPSRDPFARFRVRSQAYVDGGVGANNPSLLMCSELRDIWKEAADVGKYLDSKHESSESSDAFTEAFVSIGVSKRRKPHTEAKGDSTKSILRRDRDLLPKMKALSVSSIETDILMRSRKERGEIANYFRLITERFSLSISSLDDWQEVRKRGSQTSNPDLDSDRRKCAEQLVQVKQRRERTGRWVSFAGPLSYYREEVSAESFALPSSPAGSLNCVGESPRKVGSYPFSEDDDSTSVRRLGAGFHDALEVPDSSAHAKISRTPSRYHRVFNSHACTFMWRVPEFYKDLNAARTPECFYNIVTINRICGDKYWACTCISFIETCWPNNGAPILELASKICQVLSEEDAFQEDNIKFENLSINVRANTNRLILEPVGSGTVEDACSAASGPFRMLVDCMRWLICALMPSDQKKGIFRTNMVSVSEAQTYVIAFKPFDRHRDQYYCWTKMFFYACVIDLGFDVEKPPVLIDGLCKLAEKEPAGLKMDYDLMLDFAGIDFFSMYDGGLILNGFDTALVPLQGGPWPNHSRWHLWRTPGKRIRIDDLKLSKDRDKIKDAERFKGKSVHLGWVVDPKIVLGTSLSATSDLKGSRVKTVRKVLDSSQLALAMNLQQQTHPGGPLLGGQIQRTYNYGQTVVPANRLHQFELLINSSKTKQVILYDEDIENATLIPVVALLVFASLTYINHNGYTHFSRNSQPLKWEPVKDLDLPSECYDIATECEKVLLANTETKLSKDVNGSGPVAFKDVVQTMEEAIDRGNDASRNPIDKTMRSGKKALCGFDLREAIRTEDIYFRRLKCTASMKAWAAVAKETAVIFANGLGGLIIPACGSGCETTYPGLLNGTVLSLKTEYSRDVWNDSDQHRRMKNTDSQWIIHGKPFSQCRHRHRTATSTCDDIGRIQEISQNSNFKAVFHRHKEMKRQLNVLGNISAVWKEGMWSQRVWSDGLFDCKLDTVGAVRFGKVKSGTRPIALRPHGVSAASSRSGPTPPPRYMPMPGTMMSSGATLNRASASVNTRTAPPATNGSRLNPKTRTISATAIVSSTVNGTV